MVTFVRGSSLRREALVSGNSATRVTVVQRETLLAGQGTTRASVVVREIMRSRSDGVPSVQIAAIVREVLLGRPSASTRRAHLLFASL